MDKKATRSRLAGVPAWALSLLTLVVVFGFLTILQILHLLDYEAIETGAYILCALFIIVACYFICRAYPKSVWYTPLICNSEGILAVVFYPYTNPDIAMLIYFGSMFVLSVTGSIVGAQMGRRIIDKAK